MNENGRNNVISTMDPRGRRRETMAPFIGPNDLLFDMEDCWTY